MVPEMEEKVFSIISEAGDAKSDVMMSLKEIKKVTTIKQNTFKFSLRENTNSIKASFRITIKCYE